MAEEKKEKKGFFKEFKEFIARGNVLDMAVGIIIGGAFTAIVNALCNNILKPIINWILAAIFGADSLTGVFTFLRKVVDAEGVVDLTQSIYIDWGTCINAVINFILTALVLFLILKAVMKVSKMREEAKKALEEAAEKRKAEKAAEAAAAAPAAAEAGEKDAQSAASAEADKAPSSPETK